VAGAQRLFTALWPDDAVRHALAQAQACWSWPSGAARVKPERLHATLHFLGNVPAARIPLLDEAIARVGFEPFSLEFGLPDIWAGGIAVLQPRAMPPQLLALHAKLGEAIGGLGLPVESRAYRAHVTLARRASGAKPPAEAPALPWEVNKGFVLVRSLPGGRGYEVIGRYG
jgi:2'-5' RNA ligase